MEIINVIYLECESCVVKGSNRGRVLFLVS